MGDAAGEWGKKGKPFAFCPDAQVRAKHLWYHWWEWATLATKPPASPVGLSLHLQPCSVLQRWPRPHSKPWHRFRNDTSRRKPGREE